MFNTAERGLLFSIQTKKSHKSLTLPPSAGSDDFRLLRDSSSRHSFPISHTQSVAASTREKSGRHISASLCPVKVSPAAQKTIYCKHLNRYGLQRTAYGHVVVSFCFSGPSFIWCCGDGEMVDGVTFIETLSSFVSEGVSLVFFYNFCADVRL